LVLTCLVLLTCGTGCHTFEPGIHVDSDLAALTPPTATAIAGVDFDGLKKSQLYQQHSSQLNLAALNSLPEQIGLDPRRDVSRLLVYFQNDRTVMLVRGSFSNETVTRKLLALGGTRSTYKGHALILSNANEAIFFPAHDIAAAGSLQSLRLMIDETAARGGISEDLRSRLRLLPAADQVWFAMNGTIPTVQLTGRSDVGSMLTSLAGFVNGGAGGIGFDTGIHVQADLSCISQNGAQQVRDAFRGLIGFARLSTRDNQKDLLRVYDAIQVAQEGSTVHLHADLAADLSETLLRNLRKTGPG
jgi:hypothetical protein